MGRVTIFSLKDCSYCIRAKALLKAKGVAFYDISLTDYPEKRDDLLRLAGGLSLPQIFFDETHIGGASALAALESEHKLDDLLKSLDTSPPVTNPALQRPDYPPKGEGKAEDAPTSADDVFCIGGDCHLKETLGDDLRRNLDIRDRTYVFKTYKSCFLGSDLVDYISKKYQISRSKALVIGEQLRTESLFDHVTRDHKLEDSGNFYRLAGDWNPMVLNTNRGWTATVENPSVCVKNSKVVLAPLLAEHTDEKDGLVDYGKVFADKRFLHFEDVTCEFQQVDLMRLNPRERKAFAINIYNLLALHAFSRVGPPLTATQRYGFFDRISYDIGGYFYSLNDIESGILRANNVVPYRFSPQFRLGDPRMASSLPSVDFRIHAALNCGAKSCPPIKQFTPEGVEEELSVVFSAFLEDPGNLQADLTKKTLCCSKIISWYRADFGKTDLATTLLPFTRGEMHEKLEVFSRTRDYKVTYAAYDWTTNAKPNSRAAGNDSCAIS